MNRVYLYAKEIAPEELRGMLDTLPSPPFHFMILEHFDRVEPSVYAPGLIRPLWLNRARFFGADCELRCRRKGERLWTVLTSEHQVLEEAGEEMIAYHREQCRRVNLWGKLLPRSSKREVPRWYEERLMQPASYLLPKAPLRVRFLRLVRSLMQPVTYPDSKAPKFVDLEVKEYLDQVENVVAHRFVGFLPHKRPEKKTKEA